jgi:hypothetical protein
VFHAYGFTQANTTIKNFKNIWILVAVIWNFQRDGKKAEQ